LKGSEMKTNEVSVKPNEVTIKIGRLVIYNTTGIAINSKILFGGKEINNCIRKIVIVLDANEIEPFVTIEIETTDFKSLNRGK